VQALQKDLPPGVLDMHLSESNMHQLHFLLSGPEDTPYCGGMCVPVVVACLLLVLISMPSMYDQARHCSCVMCAHMLSTDER
jgi:hypothetical protein